MRGHHARLLRASVITGVIIALSATAHLAGGGSLPEPAVVVGLASLTMLAVTAAARHTLTLPVLTLILAGSQLILHHLFGMLSAAAHCGSVMHAHQTMTACTNTGMNHQALDSGPGAVMFAAHALASLATAVVITRGEEALYATAAWLRPLFALPTLNPEQPAVRLSIPAVTAPPVPVPYRIAPPLRGPPVNLH